MDLKEIKDMAREMEAQFNELDHDTGQKYESPSRDLARAVPKLILALEYLLEGIEDDEIEGVVQMILETGVEP